MNCKIKVAKLLRYRSNAHNMIAIIHDNDEYTNLYCGTPKPCLHFTLEGCMKMLNSSEAYVCYDI